MASVIDEKRLSEIRLERGAHDNPEKGVCLLEAVAWLRGVSFSDHPACVSPILGAYGRRFNDRLDDENRQRLIPLIPRLVNTADDGKDEIRRQILRRYVFHVAVPRWFERVGMTAEAAELKAIDVTDKEAVNRGYNRIREIRDQAWDAPQAAMKRLRESLKPAADADAVAVAVAAAAAAAVAVADAAAAAAADADADAAAAAAAAAVAAADADGLKDELVAAIQSIPVVAGESYDQRWDKVYRVVRPIFDRAWGERFADVREEGFALFDALIDAKELELV